MILVEKIYFIYKHVGMLIPSGTSEFTINSYCDTIIDSLNNKKQRERFQKITEIFGDEFK
jgi:hypothetical protein